jgi:hypothetical protein
MTSLFGFQTEPQLKDADTNAILKASFIYNFAKMIDWPAEEKQGNFIIGIYGKTTVYQELIKKYASKDIGNQRIEIKKLSESPETANVDLLYITKDKNEEISTISKKVGNKPILIITEKTGALKEGGVINFVIVDNHLKFEINLKEANKRKLIVGSRLKDLALN